MTSKDKLETILKPLFEEAAQKCGGIFTDFQLSEGYPVELQLTVKEIRDLKEIFDPRMRRRIELSELTFIARRP